MSSSLSWIEWLDRLERVLNSARQDVGGLTRTTSSRALAAIGRSRRQLGALTQDLRLLDRDVLPRITAAAPADPATDLQTALDTAWLHLGQVSDWKIGVPAADRERMLGTIDAALRDALYQAAVLFGPRRRRA